MSRTSIKFYIGVVFIWALTLGGFFLFGSINGWLLVPYNAWLFPLVGNGILTFVWHEWLFKGYPDYRETLKTGTVAGVICILAIFYSALLFPYDNMLNKMAFDAIGAEHYKEAKLPPATEYWGVKYCAPETADFEKCEAFLKAYKAEVGVKYQEYLDRLNSLETIKERIKK